MKKILAAIIVACMLALLASFVPSVSAGSDTGVLVSHADMAYGDECDHWCGTITGPIRGTIEFWEQPQNFVVGDTEYFFEAFMITTPKGVIQGADEGVFSLTTGDFWAHGWVTLASGHWADLVGYTTFEWGTTSDPSVLPIVVEHMPFVLSPNQPTPAHDREVAVTYGDMTFDGDYWLGAVSGDMRGTMEIHELGGTVIEGKLYFLEVSTITTNKGVVQFVDRGVYDLTTGTFFAQGQVMQASGGWKFLLGYTSVGWGTTSDPNLLPISGFFPTILVEG